MKLGEVLESRNLMEHRVAVTTVIDRRVWLKEHCAERSVLHVGCCDVPIFDPETNLHVFLAKHTDKLDGLDVSEEGIAVLRRHVAGDYFTEPGQIEKQYDVVLVPEVLEHTLNAHDFLRGIFGVFGRTYLITAPHIQWYERTRREGGLFYEEVHGDHRAWYSPYTLLNALRPFIDSAQDDVEVVLLQNTGSVAVRVTKPRSPAPFPQRAAAPPPRDVEAVLAMATAKLEDGDALGALHLVEASRAAHGDARLVYAAMTCLLRMGRNMDALRTGIERMRVEPDDPRCLELCADALYALGDPARAAELRARARELTRLGDKA